MSLGHWLAFSSFLKYNKMITFLRSILWIENLWIETTWISKTTCGSSKVNSLICNQFFFVFKSWRLNASLFNISNIELPLHKLDASLQLSRIIILRVCATYAILSMLKWLDVKTFYWKTTIRKTINIILIC